MRTNGLERVMKRWPLLLILSGSFVGCGNSTPPTEATTSVVSPAEESVPEKSSSALGYEQYLKAADDSLKARKGNEAVQLLTQAIKAEPQRAEAYVKRGAVLAEAKLFTQAITDMTAALKIDSRNARILNTRGYYHLLSQQHDRAAQDFGDAIGLDLNYPQPYNNRGLVWIAQGKHEDAIKDFDNALKAKPDYVDAHNNRGFALMQLNRHQEAVQAFSSALKINPKYINALTNRGRCHLKLNQAKEAATDFTAAIAIQPDTISHHTSRAEALRMAGDEAGAVAEQSYIVWLKQLTEINQRLVRNTRDADAWADRGRHLLQQNRQDDARRSLQNALAIKADHPVALAGRAQFALSEQKYAEAIEDCTKALETDRRFENFSLRGDAYFATGEFTKALADYEAARRFDRQVVETYRQRAQKFRTAGDDQRALADEQYAEALQKQLTEAVVGSQPAAPRAMVIEQVKFEEAAKDAPTKNK